MVEAQADTPPTELVTGMAVLDRELPQEHGATTTGRCMRAVAAVVVTRPHTQAVRVVQVVVEAERQAHLPQELTELQILAVVAVVVQHRQTAVQEVRESC